eukprot:TRINITY_DN690_c0_g1_i1.p1 TRINITY_DN690_c0_g1~~TRINITY_DN690_c0_g1_i1.p1  ORF type:complete len:678 (-),score=123.93 TRINITY_DN690_c0_g1_i1:407-2356(-)
MKLIRENVPHDAPFITSSSSTSTGSKKHRLSITKSESKFSLTKSMNLQMLSKEGGIDEGDGFWVAMKKFKSVKYKKFWIEFTPNVLLYYSKHPYQGGEVKGTIKLDDNVELYSQSGRGEYSFHVRSNKKKFSFKFYSPVRRDEFEAKCIDVCNTSDDGLEVDDFTTNILEKQCLDPNFCADDTEEVEDVVIENWWDITLYDFDMQPKTVGDLVGDNSTIFFLLRHYGCVLCKHLIWKILRRLEDFEKLGFQIVAVGSGTAEIAAKFKDELQFPGIILNDPDRYMYRAFNLKKHVKFTRKTLGAFQKAAQVGLSNSMYHKSMGSSMQLGGCVVLNKSYGMVYRHKENFMGNTVDLDHLVKTLEQFSFSFPDATWTSVLFPVPWEDIIPETVPFMLISECCEGSYNIERGCNTQVPLSFSLLGNIKYFQSCFKGKVSYSIWYYESEKNPVIIVIENAALDRRALIFTKRRIIRVLVPHYIKRDSVAFSFIMKHIKEDMNIELLKLSPKVIPDIVHLEDSLVPRTYRFGVLFAPEGALSEEEIYNNDYMSDDFLEFLHFLGEEIPLAGWEKFNGGLNTSENMFTGETSYYTTINDSEVMFHVGPLIPQNEDDPSRKRFIGNDVVVIIFTENQEPIDISEFESQLNRLFLFNH